MRGTSFGFSDGTTESDCSPSYSRWPAILHPIPEPLDLSFDRCHNPFARLTINRLPFERLRPDTGIFRRMGLAQEAICRKILCVSNARRAIEPIRILLIHPRALFRSSLARLLETERDFELVAECAGVAEALESLVNASPDVILFDFNIWQDLIPAARDASYQGRFLAIAEDIDAAHCVRALSGGVSGVVLGADSPSRLIQAIHVVVNGAAWVDQSVIQLLADRYPHHEDLCLDALAEREQAVLKGILGGLTNRKIADRIGTSESTVKAILQHLFARTGVRTRSQLVRIMLADQAVHSNAVHSNWGQPSG